MLFSQFSSPDANKNRFASCKIYGLSLQKVRVRGSNGHMKQLLQNLKTGVLDTPEIPCREPRRGEVLVQTHATLISAGTERMLLDFGKANWVQKARLQPDKARQVLDKIRTDGILPAIESVQAKLDHPISLRSE